MALVFCPKDQRYCARPDNLGNFFNCTRAPVKFVEVALCEFFPLRRIMAEPLAQLTRRRELFHPVLDASFLFPDSTRPHAVNQNAHAVAFSWRIVSSFELNSHISAYLKFFIR